MGENNYRPLIDDMTWSYSRITSFEDCRYRFFLKYICECDEVPKFYASYGSFMHELLELYCTGAISKDDMLVEFLSRFSDAVRGERPAPTTVEKYVGSAVEYLQSFTPFNCETVAVEKLLKFEIEGLPFIGFVDYLGERNGDLVIIDHKSRDLRPRSHRKKLTAKDEELDEMLRQLYLYAIGVKQEYGRYPKSLCFNCFRTGVFIEEPFDEEACKAAADWAVRTINMIKRTSNFYPNIDYFACRYICGVSEECEYDQILKEGRGRVYS